MLAVTLDELAIELAIAIAIAIEIEIDLGRRPRAPSAPRSARIDPREKWPLLLVARRHHRHLIDACVVL